MAGSEKKSIAMCMFDLINTKNQSGGMIGPGNCLWLHNLMFAVCGSVSEWYKKLIKNHTCIHDACGFMMTFHEIGPGYIYGLFSEALKISSGGAKRGGFDKFFSSWCCMGQFSSLTSVVYLMKTVKAPCFNEHDNTNELEEQLTWKI